MLVCGVLLKYNRKGSSEKISIKIELITIKYSSAYHSITNVVILSWKNDAASFRGYKIKMF